MSSPDTTGSPLAIDFSAVDPGPEIMRLLLQEKEEFEAVLGRPVEFRPAAPDEPAWTARRDTSGDGAPVLRRVTDDGLLSIAQSPADLLATINALHTLVSHDAREVSVAPVSTVDDAVDLIRHEIAHTYPSFVLRGLDWAEICGRHLRSLPSLADFPAFASAWVAELGDAHTTIKVSGAGGFNPPYRGILRPDGAQLTRVPVGTAAHDAGVRAGWTVVLEDPSFWARTVGASPQQVAQVRARRALAFSGEIREFVAIPPDGGDRRSWTESAQSPSPVADVSVTQTVGGSATMRVASFGGRVDVHSALDGLIHDATRDSTLTIDLRGNTGGSLLLATSLRDRFLREQTIIGSVAFTDGRGNLAERRVRTALPSERPLWPGSLEILTDAMTYSASEDFILGLQGLEHVTVRGTVTGGGSGRPRRIPVLPGIDLMVSTAITYDRQGRPVEFRGIHPDAA